MAVMVVAVVMVLVIVVKVIVEAMVEVEVVEVVEIVAMVVAGVVTVVVVIACVGGMSEERVDTTMMRPDLDTYASWILIGQFSCLLPACVHVKPDHGLRSHDPVI